MSMNCTILEGRIISEPLRKKTNSGNLKVEFQIASQTRLGEIKLVVVCFGETAERFDLVEGMWGVFSGSLDGTHTDKSRTTISFALVLRDFYPLTIPQTEFEQAAEPELAIEN